MTAITPADRTLKSINVSRCFAGHIPRPTVKVVLAQKLMDRETSRLLTRQHVEPICPPTPPPTGIPELDRLVALALRLRKEAALWLGFSRYGRKEAWRDEYGFALALYGLMNARFDYEPPEAECALVASGFSAARMPSVPRSLARQIDDWQPDSGDFASYRVPLAVVHRHWTAQQYEQARELVERLVLDVKSGSPAGQLRMLSIRQGMRHAIPLIAEAALIEMEAGGFREAEPLLEGLRPLARVFGDFETLDRIGRLFKDSGDTRWEQSGLPFDRFWVFGTRGEAAVLLGKDEDAKTFYRAALAELTPAQGGMAHSAYKQLCRLWKAFGEEHVGPILHLFETSDFARFLKDGYVGRRQAAGTASSETKAVPPPKQPKSSSPPKPGGRKGRGRRG